MAEEAQAEGTDNAEAAEAAAESGSKRRFGGLIKRLLVGVGLLVFYAALAAGSTWPLALDLGAVLPLGTYEDATVPYMMAWGLWWTSEALAAGGLGLFDAPIFFPMENAFALSEFSPFMGVVMTPLFSLGLSPAFAHNAALLLALTLNGVAAYGLLRSFRLHWLSAVAGGAMMVMLPAVHQEMGTLNFVPLFGILWTFGAMCRFSRAPSWKTGLLVALCYAITFLLCMQYALFLAMTALPASLMLFRLRHLKPRGLVGLVTLLFAVALFVGPLAYIHGSTLSEEGLLQGPNITKQGAASALSWLTVPWRQFVMAAGVEVAAEPGNQALFPGLFKVLFACIGIFYGLRRTHLRRFTLFVVLVAALGVFWSIAATVFAGAGGLYEQLQGAIPGLSFVASTWRVGILTQVGLVILAALGLQRALRVRLLVHRPGHSEPSPLRGLPIVIIFALVATAEMFPGLQRVEETPSHASWAPVGEWVKENIPEGEAVAFAPVPGNRDRAEYEEIARWMYLQPVIDRPMVNGYALHEPRSHAAFVEAMRSFPSTAANEALDTSGARWLITTSPILKSRIVEEGPKTGWARMYTNDDLGVVVHERVTR
ncbi:MAG: hypothetical protein ACPGU1_17500 [Myxococcota bacterium]